MSICELRKVCEITMWRSFFFLAFRSLLFLSRAYFPFAVFFCFFFFSRIYISLLFVASLLPSRPFTMADSTREKHGFFQSIQSVLPIHNPLHRHNRAEDDIIRTSGRPVTDLPAHLTEPPSVKTRKKADAISAADQLTLFRSLVGIDNPPGLHDSTFFRNRRPADNIGIYKRVVDKEAKAASSYKWFSAFISFCISAQVLVAACLTALGAGNASHRAVTAFGALNTVLAGFMAYFKGSGLPNRLKYYKNEWTKLREYIEQRERDFCRQDHMLDLEAEVLRIELMYEEVKGDVEANTPDSFVSVRDISRRGEKGGARSGGLVAPSVGANVVDGVVDRVQERFVDPAAKSVEGLKRNLSYQSSYFGDKVAGYGNQAARYGDDKITGLGNQAARYGDEKISTYGNQTARYRDEKMATATAYTDEKLTSATNYGNEKLANAANFGMERLSSAERFKDEKLASAQNYGSEVARPYQEAASGYREQAEEAKEKLSDLGQKAFNVAGRVSSFLERPPSVGLHVERRASPPPLTPHDDSKKVEKKAEDMV